METAEEQPRDAVTVCLVMGERSAEICGVSDYTRHLCDALREIGGVNVRLHAVNDISGRADVAAVRRTFGLIRRSAPDVVHFQLPSVAYNKRVAPFLLPSLIRWGTRRRPRVVLTFHESSNPTRLWECRYGAALLAADAVIRVAPTVEVAGWHKTLLSRRRELVVPIASTIAVREAGKAPDARTLFRAPVTHVMTSFGLVIAEKRIEEMLDWVATQSGIGLLIVGGHRPGDPYPERIRRRIQDLDLTPRVVMTGWRAEEEVAGYLRSSDAVLVPVVRPQSGAYRAAYEHGIPVVSLTPPGVSDPTTGVVVLEALRGQPLDEVLKEARAEMKRASARVTWDEIARIHRALYRDLARER